MDPYYRQQMRQPIFQNAPISPLPPPLPVQRQGTGILKYPFGFYDSQKQPSGKTLRFEMDQPAEPVPAPLQEQSVAQNLLVASPEGSGTNVSSISSAYTTGAEDEGEESYPGTEAGEPAPNASTTSPAASVEVSTTGAKASTTSRLSSPLDEESGATSNSATRTSGTSMTSQSISEEIKRFLGDVRRASGRGRVHVPALRAAAEHRNAPPHRDSWRAMSRRYALLTLLSVLLMLMLVGISADVYGTLYRGSRDRTPAVPFENTVAARQPEPEGRGMPLIQPRWPSVATAQESDTGTDQSDSPEEVPEADSSGAPPAPSEDERPPISTEIVSGSGDEAMAEPADVQEIMEGRKTDKEIASAALKSSRGSGCDMPSFTYCPNPSHEFYYEYSIHACVDTATHRVGVCSRGINRFRSKKNCRERCVEGSQSSEQCMHTPLFVECESEDVAGAWWHFDGRACQRWNFTSGLCPAQGGTGAGAFASLDECSATCVGRPRSRLCRGSRSDTCFSDQLRFPYFAAAAEYGEGPPRCLKVSSATNLGRLCLTGTNRFPTMKACHMTCVSNRSDTEPWIMGVR